jgi:hypothetical protein
MASAARTLRELADKKEQDRQDFRGWPMRGSFVPAAAATDFAALADEVETLQKERDQQERFKWAANERVERLEAVRDAAQKVLADGPELRVTGDHHSEWTLQAALAAAEPVEPQP